MFTFSSSTFVFKFIGLFSVVICFSSKFSCFFSISLWTLIWFVSEFFWASSIFSLVSWAFCSIISSSFSIFFVSKFCLFSISSWGLNSSIFFWLLFVVSPSIFSNASSCFSIIFLFSWIFSSFFWILLSIISFCGSLVSDWIGWFLLFDLFRLFIGSLILSWVWDNGFLILCLVIKPL